MADAATEHPAQACMGADQGSQELGLSHRAGAHNSQVERGRAGGIPSGESGKMDATLGVGAIWTKDGAAAVAHEYPGTRANAGGWLRGQVPSTVFQIYVGMILVALGKSQTTFSFPIIVSLHGRSRRKLHPGDLSTSTPASPVNSATTPDNRSLLHTLTLVQCLKAIANAATSIRSQYAIVLSFSVGLMVLISNDSVGQVYTHPWANAGAP
jgi:hypothetical protein